MNNICQFDLSDFISNIENVVSDSELSPQDILRKITSLAQNHSLQEQDINKTLSEVQEILEEYGLSEDISQEDLQGALEDSLNSSSIDEAKDQTSDSLDKDSMYIENKEIYSKSLKIEAFDGNSAAFNYFNNVVTDLVIKSMIWNGSKIIASDQDINIEINKYQEKLYQQVLNYLKQQGCSVEDLPQTLYTNNFSEYTEALEKVRSLFKDFFDKKLFNNRTLQSKFLALAISGNKEKIQTEIDGYTAWVILNNFDNTIKTKFSSSIGIDNTLSPFTPANSSNSYKYSFASAKSSNMNTTWRTSEDIDITKEINNIVQLITESIPLLGTERNLKFSEFGYSLIQLKKLAWVIPNASYNQLSVMQQYQLSNETRKTFEEAGNVLGLIANIRTDSQKYLPAIFEIFSNTEIRNTLLGQEYFQPQDIAILTSIYKGIFDRTDPNSLISAQDNQGYISHNYFGYLTEAADSISSVNYLQYFRNSDGKIYARNMYDQTIDRIVSDLTNQFTISNSRLLASYDRFKDKVTPQIENNVLSGLTYKFTDNLFLKVLPNKVELIRGKDAIQYTQLNDEEIRTVKEFIDQILHQNFRNNSEYWDNLIVVSGNRDAVNIKDREAPVIDDLLTLSGHILFNERISSVELKDSTNIDTILNSIYGDSNYKPTYNFQLEEINLTSKADLYIIQNISMAKAITTGRLTAAVIKDGNNKSLPSSSLSRLLGNIWTQVLNQVQQEGSAAKDFILFKPGVLSGVYQAREFKDFQSSQATDHKEFNAGEMVTAELLYDFIEGLKISTNTRSPLGSGKVAFFPAVYSDKSYIGRNIVDLNQIYVDGQSVASLFTEADGQIVVNPKTSQVLNQLLLDQLGTYYRNVDAAVANIWQKISAIRDQYGDSNSIYNTVPIDYRSGFYLLNEAYDNSDKSETPLQYISNIVREYNKTHPNDIIQLVNQTCYEEVGGFLKSNIGIKSMLGRYTDMDSIDRFFTNQENNLIVKLLKNRISGIYVAKIGDNYISSIEDLYKLPGANITMNPEDILRNCIVNPNIQVSINPIISAYNKLNYLVTQEWLCGLVGGQFNHPSKANKYLGMTYVPKDADQETAEFIEANQKFVRAGYNTNKLKNTPANRNLLEQLIIDEATRFVAQVKRNVSYTATQHAYNLNSLTGVPTEANVTVIPDNLTTIRTVNGTETQVLTSDGATYVNPFMGEWENGSLGGAKVGTNKKQFIHAYDQTLGVGAIIKTAGFTFTNETMRNSIFDRVAVKYMTDRTWLDENGTPLVYNIFQDYNGNPIQTPNIYIKQGNKFYKIIGIESLGNNRYQRKLQEVTSDNGVTNIGEVFAEDPVTVQSNYDLWNLFGGFNCYEQLQGELSLTPSEASIKAVADIANCVGIKKNDVVRTQGDLYQFMKHSDIHYMPTEGALKQYQTNMEDINDDLNSGHNSRDFIDYFKIRLYQAGIQLDKEHNADDEDLSIFTQVISACAAMGYNTSEAQEMYDILAELAKESTAELQSSYNSFLEFNDVEGFQNTIAKIIARAFMNQNSSSEAISYTTTELLKMIREGKQAFLKDAIPYSDAGLYNKIISTIGSTLTKAAIKVKMAGVLAILCPSHNRYKIYNNELLNGRTQEDLDAAQTAFETSNNNILTNDNLVINFDRSYKLYCDDLMGMLDYLRSKNITNARIVDNYISWDINTIADYNLLNQIRKGTTPEQLVIQQMSSEIAAIKEAPIQTRMKYLKQHPDIEPIETIESFIGDRLASEHINTTDLTQFLKEHVPDKTVQNYFGMYNKNGIPLNKFIQDTVSKWNTTHPDNTADNSEILDVLIDIFTNYSGKSQISNIGRLNALQYYQPPVISRPTSIFENIAKGRNLAGYNVQFIGSDQNGVTQKYSLYDCDVIQENINNGKTVSREDTQAVLNALSKNRPENKVLIRGHVITVDKSSIQINPSEIILPKVFRTRFGLKTNDQLSDILKDPQFFTKKLINQVKTVIPVKNFSVCLSTIGKNNVYVLDRNQSVENNNFKRVVMVTKTNSDGTIDRLDSEGKVLYTLSKTVDDLNSGAKQDELWQYTDANGIVREVIVTDNIKHYLNNLQYNYIKLSPEISQEVFDSIKDNVPEIAENIGDKPLKKAIIEINDKFNSNPLMSKIRAEGAAIYTSFKKSLEIVAARIPAQSLQSVMTMKVAGFVNSDINTAYVSTLQTFLQGSDYDIDSVSLAMFDFGNGGKFIGWSPYFKLNNTQMLEASLTLPFPQAHSIPIADSRHEYDLTPIIKELTDTDKPDAIIVETQKGWKLNLNTPEKVITFGNLIRHINKYGLSFTEKYRALDEFLTSVVNRHNYYVQNMKNSRIRESAIKNRLQQAIFNIVNNPRSQQEAQEGVDQVTKPFKKLASESILASEEAHNVPESFTTQVESLRNNQVGKKAVGISAVALKSYFALTQAYNKALENISASEDLVGSVNIGGVEYKTLSNITCENPNKLAKKIIDYAAKDQDFALALSAFVSLSTDNAKDLALAKLNCGDNTMGMWLYGISLGVPATTLMHIMTSPAALALTEELKGNIFAGKNSSSFSQVFSYLHKGPVEALKPYIQNLAQLFSVLKIPYTDADAAISTLVAYMQNTQNLSELLSLIKITTEDEIQNILIHYLRLWTTCNINGTGSTYKDFVRLVKGSEEFRTIGQLLHINQGLETVQQDILNRISILENATTTRESSRISEKYNNSYTAYYRALYNQIFLHQPGDPLSPPYRQRAQTSKIDLHKFLYDLNYQKQAIRNYNDVKEIYNPLFLIVNVPHYNEYFKLLDMQDKMNYITSVKYRTIKNLSSKVINDIGAITTKDKEKVLKRVSDYVNNKLITSFFLNSDIVIEVPANTVVYVNGKTMSTNSSTKLNLGTADGRASFKVWMETKVIPDLQRGYNGARQFDEISNNRFISELTPIVYDTTPTGKPLIAHSLSISMSPRNDSDQAIFDSYKGEFNKLANSGIKYFVGDASYNIADLLFWYNLCVFQNKQNDSSLAKIFEDQRGYGTIKNYYDFVTWMDKNSNILSPVGIEEYMVIPFDNPWASTLKKFLYRNKRTNQIEVWSNAKIDYDEMGEFEYDDENLPPINIRGYHKDGAPFYQLQTFYYVIPQTHGSEVTDTFFSFTSDNQEYVDNQGKTVKVESVQIKHLEEKILDVLVNGKSIKEEEGYEDKYFSKIPIVYVEENGELVAKYNLKQIIDDAITLKDRAC